MNIFQQYGIKEVADVTLYAIELDENEDEVYIPVLYFDTLKVSTVEQTASEVSAQGGLGNAKLITWDYDKDITVTLEDALFTPASQSIVWGGKMGAKTLSLYLRNFYDRGTDSKNPNANLRGAVLTLDTFSDFLIIPDRYPTYEMKGHLKDTRTTGYAGGTSIYCWLASGHIVSNDGKKRVTVKDLILFYREQTQRWYFFNGGGPCGGRGTSYAYATSYQLDGENYFHCKHQYGKDVFEWIQQNLSGDNYKKWESYIQNGTETFDYNYNDSTYSPTVYQDDGTVLPSGIGVYNKDVEDSLTATTRWTEYEDVAKQQIQDWGDNAPCAAYGRGPIYNVMAGDVGFLTQALYIDGYRTDKCARSLLYSDLTESEIQLISSGYEPYRYFTSVDVTYNTNIVPPQECIYQTGHALEDAVYLDRMETCKASDRFCIDTDVNMKHSNYRYMDKYANTELTVYIDPKTMQPYEPNTSEYYRKNGQRITGNLRAFKQYEKYLKWTRTKAYEHTSLGNTIVIDAAHFPGTYRLVGETYCRSRKTGKDSRYQFEIPLCKMGSDTNLTLQADGDPTTFSMTLTAMRRQDGVMMKLTQYDVVDKKYGKKTSGSTEILQHSSTQDPSAEDLESQNVLWDWTSSGTTTSEQIIDIHIVQPENNTEYVIGTDPEVLIPADYNDSSKTDKQYIKVTADKEITTISNSSYSLNVGNNETISELTENTSIETTTTVEGLKAADYSANLNDLNG